MTDRVSLPSRDILLSESPRVGCSARRGSDIRNRLLSLGWLIAVLLATGACTAGNGGRQGFVTEATPRVTPLATEAPPAKATPKPKATSKPKATAKPTSYYKPRGWDGYSDVNCSDFDTHAHAQSFFKGTGGTRSNDPYGLDRDSDGIACESMP